MATPVIRSSEIINRFRLDYRFFKRIQIPSVKAITVTAAVEGFGSWTNSTIEVRKVIGPSSYAFATAKTIAVGGGSVSISSSELEGVGEIEIVTKDNAGAFAVSNTFAAVSITFEQEVSTPAAIPSTSALGRSEGDDTQAMTPPIV